MKYFFSTILFLSIFADAHSQVIPQDRIVNWDIVTNNMAFTQPQQQLNVKNYGAKGDGITDDYQSIINAITDLDGQAGYIYFPQGNYLVKNTLVLPDSCILKGDGSDLSTISFDLDGVATNCINISKSQQAEFTPITGGLDKGSNLITLENTQGFEPGDYVEIRQKNGSWDVVPISWAEYSVGQITTVVAVVGNKLLINSPLRIDYSEDLEPEVRPIYPIFNAGVQCIKIRRVDEPSEGSGANIYMNKAANCFVRGVESDTSVGAHVGIYASVNILIDGNYFHHAFTYDGSGMRGYGVALSDHTSECLITNNIFRYLRHAMMIKTGSNGNVFSYNYSIEPNRSEPISDASGDISFHGHYAFSNLFEGNIVQNIIIDHYWGPTGPYNTLFRNRAELYGIIMTTSTLMETDKQNFVGNEVTNTEFLHGLYTLSGEDHFEYSNNIQGTIVPTGTNTLNDSSYYLSEAPEFWSFMNWPSIGTPIDPGTGTIPAKIRYLEGSNYTICPDSITTTIEHFSSINENKVEVYPIPASNTITIKTNLLTYPQTSLKIFDNNGRVVYYNQKQQPSNEIIVNIAYLKDGIYFLIINNLHGSFTKKFIVKN